MRHLTARLGLLLLLGLAPAAVLAQAPPPASGSTAPATGPAPGQVPGQAPGQPTPPVVAAPQAGGPAAPAARAPRPDRPGKMVVSFEVRDYAAWRPVFDAAAPQREAEGLTNPRIYRDADRPQAVLVLFEVADRSRARHWLRSGTLRSLWERAGVVGQPQSSFLR
jgi:hypothetical protein